MVAKVRVAIVCRLREEEGEAVSGQCIIFKDERSSYLGHHLSGWHGKESASHRA